MPNPPRITAPEFAELSKLFDAWLALKLLGWQEPRYFKWPEPGIEFELIELGSTGIHRACRHSLPPEKTCWVDGDWPSTPFLVRKVSHAY
jgi:hypothetical protein